MPYKVGDLVFVKTFPQSNAALGFSAKLAPRFRGPLKLVEFLSPVIVSLRDPLMAASLVLMSRTLISRAIFFNYLSWWTW